MTPQTTTQTAKTKEMLVITKTAFKVEPGAGAIQFARELYYKYAAAENDPILTAQRIIDAEYPEHEHKKVKCCQYCGYFFRDKTKNNSSKVCSDDCKAGKDVVMRTHKRRTKAADKPRKLTNRQKYYYSHYEYPFWINEYEMMKDAWSRETLTDEIEKHEAKRELKEKNGGKRRGEPEKIEYNGDEGYIRNIQVKLTPYNRELAKVHVKKMTAEKQTAYLLKTYGALKLAQERRRALIFERNGRRF